MWDGIAPATRSGWRAGRARVLGADGIASEPTASRPPRTAARARSCPDRTARTRSAARARPSDAVAGDDAGDLDRRGRDHLDVDALAREHGEHLRRDTGVGAHAGADDRDLAHVLLGDQLRAASSARGSSAARPTRRSSRATVKEISARRPWRWGRSGRSCRRRHPLGRALRRCARRRPARRARPRA